MFDLGMAELLLIGIVALIVVGPKDLPGMFRALGRFTGKARRMAREFSRAMEEAADEAGVKDLSNTLKKAASPKSMGLDALNRAAEGFEKWEPGRPKTVGNKPAVKEKGAPAREATEKQEPDATQASSNVDPKPDEARS